MKSAHAASNSNHELKRWKMRLQDYGPGYVLGAGFLSALFLFLLSAAARLLIDLLTW